ncbi:MAG: hypothetical protein EB053_01305, partial [Chlamydiae bacterium]|nr:hypothetical protein [Chlamydiota bacterium]
SAGQTASYKAVYRQNFECPAGAYAPLALQNKEETKWTKEIAIEEITERYGLSSVRKVDLFIDHDSQKVYAVRFFDRTKHIDIPIADLKTILPSNNFKIDITPHSLKIQGWGKGLGVGLCLYNATRLDSEGAQVEEILKSAFPQVTLEIKNSVPELIGQVVEEEPMLWYTKKISALNE